MLASLVGSGVLGVGAVVVSFGVVVGSGVLGVVGAVVSFGVVVGSGVVGAGVVSF